MPPTLALLSGLVFIGWMFRRDRSWRQLPSSALWVPGIWLALCSSRQLAFWLQALGIAGGGSSNLEGSPINIIFNTSLFVIALVVLKRRKFSWLQWTFSNKALFAIYAFFLCSMVWSAFPLPTLKRLIQDFGSVIIGLVVLTETDPAAALRIVSVRVSYVLFPLSVIFMRYFPDIGRSVSEVSGTHMVSGVADHKNSLGQLAMVFCLVLLFDMMQTRDSRSADAKRPEQWARLLNLGIGLYLLYVAASAAAQLCFLVGLVLLFVSGRLARMKSARTVFMCSALAVLVLVALQQTYDLSTNVSEALGRGSGLTGRTEIWEATLAKAPDPWFGAGFRGFWETPAGMSVAQELRTNRLLTAHNGYIEVYLYGGIVALCLLGAWLWATGLNSMAKLVSGDPIGRLCVVFWPLLLLYNVSESAFFQPGPIWLIIFMATLDVARQPVREKATNRVAMVRHQLESGQRNRYAKPFDVLTRPTARIMPRH
jgi:O-antigen ligase